MEKIFSHASVSHSPLPSFLIRTPLGTPHEETVELKAKVEAPVIRQQEGRGDIVPLSKKPFEQKKQVPKKLKQKTEQPKNLARSYKRNGEGNGFIYRWIGKEVGLSMSKISIMSLVLGFLFLGSLFFIIGFLAAVATLKPEEGGHSSAWQALNTHHQEGQVQGGRGSRGLGRAAGHSGGSIVGNMVRKQLGPLGKVIGAASAVVPQPLQPFARYGIASARTEVRNVGGQGNPFGHHRRMMAPAQQVYGGAQNQPSGAPQQYAISQAQPYGIPASTGYQQPTALPQGGQGGYGQGYPSQQPIMPQPMQQQPMYQQPYYQQPPPQPMASQQMMAQQPQIGPQQQMIQQAPPYPQQMAPQQGYYR